MRILHGVICEHAEARKDGRLDIHGIFHHLFAPGFPARQDDLVLVLGIEWNEEGPGRREFGVDLIDPSGSPALTIRGHTDVRPRKSGEPPPRTQLVMPMRDVIFPSPGTYLFRLALDGETYPLAPLHLIERPDVRGAPGPPGLRGAPPRPGGRRGKPPRRA